MSIKQRCLHPPAKSGSGIDTSASVIEQYCNIEPSIPTTKMNRRVTIY